MNPTTLLVIAKPESGYLKALDRLPKNTRMVVSSQPAMFDELAPEADVLLNCMMPKALLREVFLKAPNLRWVHSLSVGVEGLLFQELVESEVPLTNARGAFSRSLAEFVMLGALFFDKKIPDMRQQQSEGRWVNMDVDEVYGKTLGIVSYGSIGQACAKLAKAFGMNVWAMRKRPEMSKDDPLVDRLFGLDGLREMMAGSDFVVVCTPLTPDSRGLVGAAEIAAMKSSAVFLNVGRGAVVDEDALVAALQQGKIRGAALDVFATEPLPAGHPFYTMDNVLLSPHSADHTPGWVGHSMDIFISNFERYRKGDPLDNIVNKKEGY
ncbi:MAG: D-2-hydroxyacid dehydrogenase [Bryobacteraceae bacterium]